MTAEEPSSIQTRPSLLARIKQGDDTEAWQEFYRVYGKLVRDFALHAGLTDTEADEVVQETAIAMARHLPGFRYDPKACRFKTWLLNLASWRIKDQLKKRKKLTTFNGPFSTVPAAQSSADETSRTSTLNRLPDPAAIDLERVFEVEWRKNLVASALEQVKPKFSLKQFQIFELAARQEWPAADIARALGVSLANVYVTRHRFTAALMKEIARLERRLERAATRALQ